MEGKEIKTDIYINKFDYKPKSKIFIGKDNVFTIYTEQKIKFIKSNDIYLITEKDTNEEVQEKLNKIKRGSE